MEGSSGWRPGERVHKTLSTQNLVENGPWRDSAILDNHSLQGERPTWGKGEVIISATKRMSMLHTYTPKPTPEEEAFRNSHTAKQLASVQAELQNTYIARAFKK